MVDILAWGLRVLLCDLYHSRVKGTLSPSIFGQPCSRLWVFSKFKFGLCPACLFLGILSLATPLCSTRHSRFMSIFLSPEGSSRTPESGPGSRAPSLATVARLWARARRTRRSHWPPLGAWQGAGHFCFKAKGWREVGKGDSVTLIPRLVVELVCCDGSEGACRAVGHVAPPSHPILTV